jgi:hypothetical protein
MHLTCFAVVIAGDGFAMLDRYIGGTDSQIVAGARPPTAPRRWAPSTP